MQSRSVVHQLPYVVLARQAVRYGRMGGDIAYLSITGPARLSRPSGCHRHGHRRCVTRRNRSSLTQPWRPDEIGTRQATTPADPAFIVPIPDGTPPDDGEPDSERLRPAAYER
jgi:hypothetical protein